MVSDYRQQEENEQERYETELVCIYCGSPKLDKPFYSCCGETHFATQKEIDSE
jgi:hypothetical protein